jgi:hypothetical protein
MKILLPVVLALTAPFCLADDLAPSLSVSAFVATHQTDYGSSSQLQAGIEALYPTRWGAAYWQDGEGGWVLPAPAGWVSLGVANEPIWALGGHDSQNMGVARYGFDLPHDGSLSFGYASRLGNRNPGDLLVANLDAPIATLGRNTLRVWGWASLANNTRRESLQHEDNGNRWQLEQSNLLLMVSHPIAAHWDLNVGMGSRWAADQGGHETAGWQTLLGVTWNWAAKQSGQ